MSINTRGEHVSQYWFTIEEAGLLLRAVEEMIALEAKSKLSDETRARLRILSAKLSDDE